MLLADAGALGALLDAREPDHQACVDVARGTRESLLTTWPAFTEAMHLLGALRGWSAQEKLWRLVAIGALHVAPLDEAQAERCRALMAKYRDVPMDLADASLVALAETRGTNRIFTLDGDFAIYRLHGRGRFVVVP